MSGRGGFVWGDDGHNIPWPSTVFVARNVIQTLGWFALPTLKRGYFDEVWTILARETESAHIFKTLRFPHDNSGNIVDPRIIEADRKSFEAWLSGQAGQDVRRLGIALDRAFFFGG